MLRLSAFLLLAATLAAPAPAQVPATITPPPAGYTAILPLWPAGHVPLATALTDGNIPRLYAYPASGPGPHAAIIVMPGGGYTKLVMGKEGDVEARWLNAHGMSAYVLEYRLSPAYRYPAPLLDGARAVRYLRAHADQLSLDPAKIGVWGFSAGGHLAGYLAAIHPALADPQDATDRLSARPDFAILSYARLSLADNIPRNSSMETLLGDHPTPAQLAQIDPAAHVTTDTSPSFLYSTGGDKSVDPLNASTFYEALKRAGVPVELHIFERGPHGTGMADMQAQHLDPSLRELSLWPQLLANWLQQNQWMPPQ